MLLKWKPMNLCIFVFGVWTFNLCVTACNFTVCWTLRNPSMKLLNICLMTMHKFLLAWSSGWCHLMMFLCSTQYDWWDIMFPGCPSVLLSIRPSSHFRGTTLGAAPSKSYAFSTHNHACIAMPTWCRCAPPILFWPLPPNNLLLRSCLIWILYVDPHWWVPLCLQCPAKAMPFQQIVMRALQCQHDVDVHLLFCFDLDLQITCSWGHV